MIFLDLDEMFPQVITLELTHVMIEAATWMTLSNPSHITTLKLNGIDINASVSSEFWMACTNLECLWRAVRACVEPDGAVVITEVSKVDIIVGDTGAVDDDSSVRT